MQLCEEPNVTLLVGDLRQTNFVGDLPDAAYVYHLASINGTENFYNRPFDVLEAAVVPTVNLINRYKESELKRFLLSSTSETYASTVDAFDWRSPTAENVPLSVSDVQNPRWSYASGKIAAEAALFGARVQHGLPISIVRYHNIYGPRMGNKHVIPQFINRVKDGVFELYGHQNKRCFMYVDDAVRATRLVAESPNTEGEIFHIGTQDEITIQELAEAILQEIGTSSPIEMFDAPEGSVSKRIPDTAKFRAVAHNFSTVTLQEGLRATVSYYQNHDL
jgi:nucleoside-diphosphate-sugar epimerase